MTTPHRSLRQRLGASIAWALTVGIVLTVVFAATIYGIGYNRSATARSDAVLHYYQEKIRGAENEWEEHLMREKARLEFSRLLENSDQRWNRLRAYLASVSASPMYAGMTISNASGQEVFRHGHGFSRQWLRGDEIGSDIHVYGADPEGALFLALSQPVWLGADGLGAVHIMVPIDNALLWRLAFPDTVLYVEWQGRIVASSAGFGALAQARPGYEGRIDRDGQRYEQRRIAFPRAAQAPTLIVQARVAPPFSVLESSLLGFGVFAVLALLLAGTLNDVMRRILPRIERVGRAARDYAAAGQATPEIDRALDPATHDGGDDELSEVANSMRHMIAAVAQREEERRVAVDKLAVSERRFREVTESAGEFIWEGDAQHNLVYVSDYAAEIFGRPLEQIVGSCLLDHVPADDRDEYKRKIRRYGSKGEPFRQFHVQIVRPDGEKRWIAFSGTAMNDAEGKYIGYYHGTAEDVSRYKHAEEQLLLAEKVFANSDQAILITDANSVIVSVNPAFTVITGYAVEEALGKNPKVFASGRHDASFYVSMWKELNRTGAWAGEIWDRRKNGEVYPKWLSINTVYEPNTLHVTHYVAIFSDITERKENEARIEHLAYHDALTGLPNRYALQERLKQALADGRRYGRQVAVMFIDLDRFKTINDSLGHDVGDQLLVTVARRIRSALRESDVVARLGGDEFVIVAPDAAAPEDAARVAEKVIEYVGEPMAIAGHTLHTSPSIGIALFPADGADAEIVMRNADTAMYHAKQHGRNNYRFYTADLNSVATERLLLETQLRSATERGEIRLLYQPQIDLGTGVVIGVEALARWQHPDRGLVMPEKFIPVAEECGLIIPLGAWILGEACRQAMAWADDGLPPLRISVNVSVHQFRDRNFAQHVRDVLDHTGLPPERLELEITESAIMDNVDQTVEVMRSLGDLGVQIAIDDFGTGYSSLSYLKRLPIRRLKIDRSFIMDMENDANDIIITEGIIALARSLGLGVTAEGIETGTQLQIIRDFGCAEGQGFLFNRPLSAEALAASLGSAPQALPDPDAPKEKRRLH